jgi:hypothetical protein
MLGDQVLKNQLVQALKTDFITSPQWAAYSRNFFEE